MGACTLTEGLRGTEGQRLVGSHDTRSEGQGSLVDWHILVNVVGHSLEHAALGCPHLELLGARLGFAPQDNAEEGHHWVRKCLVAMQLPPLSLVAEAQAHTKPEATSLLLVAIYLGRGRLEALHGGPA